MPDCSAKQLDSQKRKGTTLDDRCAIWTLDSSTKCSSGECHWSGCLFVYTGRISRYSILRTPRSSDIYIRSFGWSVKLSISSEASATRTCNVGHPNKETRTTLEPICSLQQGSRVLHHRLIEQDPGKGPRNYDGI
jgi:hypothetical protein